MSIFAKAINLNMHLFFLKIHYSDEDRGGRSVVADPSTGTPMHALGARGENIIQRLDATQSRWKIQVQEQRRNIYDKHNMLN